MITGLGLCLETECLTEWTLLDLPAAGSCHLLQGDGDIQATANK